MKYLCFIFKVILILAVFNSVTNADSLYGPLKIRNLNPMISIFGLPTWPNFNSGHSSLQYLTERANHFQFANRGNELVRLDGETHRNILIINNKIENNDVVSIEIPQISHTSGSLDDFINGWHKTFGMPDGNRDMFPEDSMSLLYIINNNQVFNLTNTVKGLGDIQVNYRKVFSNTSSIFSIGVKIPSGDHTRLLGSGSPDLSITYFKDLSNKNLTSSYKFYWGFGVLATGKSRMFDNKNDYIGLGIFGLNYKIHNSLILKAQMDFHTPFYKSVLDEFKASIQANIGLLLRLEENKDITFSVGEDLIVKTAPDVTLSIDFEWSY